MFTFGDWLGITVICFSSCYQNPMWIPCPCYSPTDYNFPVLTFAPKLFLDPKYPKIRANFQISIDPFKAIQLLCGDNQLVRAVWEVCTLGMKTKELCRMQVHYPLTMSGIALLFCRLAPKNWFFSQFRGKDELGEERWFIVLDYWSLQGPDVANGLWKDRNKREDRQHDHHHAYLQYGLIFWWLQPNECPA